MESNSTIQFQEPKKRSDFLRVLCILSFTMCAVGIVSGFFNLYQTQPEVMQKTIEQIKQVDEAMADQMENQMIAMENNAFMKIYPYLNFVFILLSFVGVFMMWNFKRMGFYIYAIAELLPYSNFIFMDKDMMKVPGMPGGAMTAGLVAMIALDVLFVVLYSRNLPEMDQ